MGTRWARSIAQVAHNATLPIRFLARFLARYPTRFLAPSSRPLPTLPRRASAVMDFRAG